MAEQDDGIQKLEQFVGLLAETRSKMQELGGQIDGGAQELDAGEDGIEEHLGGLTDYVKEFTASLEADHKATSETNGTLTDSYKDVVETSLATTILAAMDTAEDAFETALKIATDQVENDYKELAEDGFEAMNTLASELQGQVDAIQQEVEQAFQAFAQAMEDFDNQADEAAKATVETFAEHDGATVNLNGQVELGFGNFNTHMSASVHAEIDSGLGELATNLVDMFTNLDDNVVRLGSDLVENGGQIMADVAQQVVQDFTSSVQDAVKDAIENFISELLKEIATNIAMLNVGAATTSAMSPYVPPLAVAKNVVGAINDLLDALNPFD